MPFGSLVQLKVFHWQSGTPQLGSLLFLLWCLQQFILVTETFDGQLRLVYSLWNLLLLFWKFDFRWEFTMVSTQFLRKRVYHLQCPYSWQYMDVTRRAMAHFQVPALPNPLWWEGDTSDWGSYRHLPDTCCTCPSFFLRQFHGNQLLERSGMDNAETLDGRWISPPLKKGVSDRSDGSSFL